ncbi:DNA double-strand break repair Rad50 ATPase [Listeria cossartiae subsp. cayugensis]|uniref:DNA double-strand break repair Rad50 ATPase n=1 Tax=Listeria cossartiae TaxID=2838249 RepID=UPI0028804447|nr:DNA double-strand break repair Rad50 ATPase [Listeria cossartiae]MDT0001197.1 DNA double-strand break repair Rad50 ATPase [Listeria cossartiae subsp. cayugensis]MDT0009581.1 DNA double-strand break repair Rad50 ATPase [Listeria cossartiae subsp. cayugensis]MDT0031227.1 DNA double-strand break repair Rad50 ATPase [Listeria cossartiae subsp. cayugensis]MDT0039343.1 DNA double-strand break repair Rad50 ATPase [Listeria cossartiae subsp. cayugensis]MDT0044878.1 DNA double-strand break repair Ra
MDSNNEKLKQQLRTLQKQQADAELSLDMLKREQNERVWLEEDFEQICYEERESLDLMREVWQGDQARNFGYYLEDLQADEKNKWRQTFQAEEEKRQEKINTYQKNIYQLESKQQDVQKELFQ